MKFLLVAFCMVAAVAASRQRRFLINRCSSEAECGPNKCCLFNRICSPKLPQYSTCHLSGITQCSCADGLECRVTKEFTVLGQKLSLRQCMPIAQKREVEQIEDEDLKEMMRQQDDNDKRFLIDRCTSESDCGQNRCCVFNKICMKKIPKDMTCYLTSKHKCGCQDGLECRVTTSITIPILGSKIPIRQCVSPA
ncbi:predicted protein [Nematostella vectensis]|uniref:Uncharacterized protein n=1 Tax=Nematostella vectensis TaxID=45351 RepID=A7TCQ4_NEMVE|nr:predicted protein [Nematostella vectensis]|eukprot:XP_001618261.1 hypothetical protein NEMVEDRAFT_v1g225333 [Nematostella vectensis]